jgi:hypothetical protein
MGEKSLWAGRQEPLESKLEEFLLQQVMLQGGRHVKLGNSGQVALPDRMVLMPGGVVGFVELKRLGERPTPAQQQTLQWLDELGFVAGYADNRQELFAFMDRLSVEAARAGFLRGAP